MMRRMLCACLCGLLGYASAEPLVLVSPLPLDEPHVARLKQVLDQAFAPLPDSYRLQYLPPKRALEALASGQVAGDISRIALYGSLVPDAIRVQPYLGTAWLYLVGRRGDSLPRQLALVGNERLAYTHGILILQQRTEGMLRREASPGDESCLKKVEAGRVRYCLLFHYRPQMEAALAPYAQTLVWRRVEALPVYLWLAPGQQALADSLGWQLQHLLRSGRLTQLMGRFREP